ncbi:hypothetical protein HN51_015509 [Arachis hypogaea]
MAVAKLVLVAPSPQPLPAQPEMMRAAEKDEQYASFVYEVRGLLLLIKMRQNLFRGNVLLCSHNRVQGSRRLGRSTVTPLRLEENLEYHYVLEDHDFRHRQTPSSKLKICFGELPAILNLEKLLIVFLFTVAGAYGLPPTPARRTIFIVYQTAIPYIADHISYGESAIRSRSSQDSAVSPSTSGQYSTTLSRLKQKLSGFWLHVVQRWPVVILLLDRLIEVINFPEVTSLHAFHFPPLFAGLYYHISKRASGIRYLFIGKPSNQRPRYQILGVFLLIQLCVIAAEGLRRRSLSSVAGSVHQASFASQQRSAGHGLPVLNEEGNLASLDTDEGGWVSNSSSSELHPVAMNNEKPECPLCRISITHSGLVCVCHSDFRVSISSSAISCIKERIYHESITSFFLG